MRTFALLVTALAACSPSTKPEEATPHSASAATPAPATPPPPAGPPPQVTIATPSGTATVDVEVVWKDHDLEQGLMYREHMAPDAGMLFLMPHEQQQTFWMRNTIIPLDMIFIAHDLKIAGVVANAEPETDTLRQVDAPSLYVLEVNGGWAAAHHVTAGQPVTFVRVPPRGN